MESLRNCQNRFPLESGAISRKPPGRQFYMPRPRILKNLTARKNRVLPSPVNLLRPVLEPCKDKRLSTGQRPVIFISLPLMNRDLNLSNSGILSDQTWSSPRQRTVYQILVTHSEEKSNRASLHGFVSKHYPIFFCLLATQNSQSARTQLLPLHRNLIICTANPLVGKQIRQLIFLSANMVETDSAKPMKMDLNSLENPN